MGESAHSIQESVPSTSATMGRQGKQKDPKIKLKQPDRSGPDPSKESLLEIARQRGLLNAQKGQRADGSDEDAAEALVGRLGEAFLWSISLTMLHFTLDVLVTHQYAVEIVWRDIILRAATAFPSKTTHHTPRNILLTYHSNSPPLLLLPSSPICLCSSAATSSPNPTTPPSNILLRSQRGCRMLPDIHHEQTWVLCRNETIPTIGVSMDLVCHRIRCILGHGESDMLWDISESWRLLVSVS